MKVYQVFRHPEQGEKAVKRGFSWPGFFFTWIWALSRQLWLPAALLLLASVVFAVIEFAAREGSRFFPMVISLLYMLYVGSKGNSWRARNLEDLGFMLLGAINARRPQDALGKIAAAGGTIPPELKAGGRQDGLVAIPSTLQGLCAIISLTWKAAFRYRFFWVIMALLLGAVVGLPLLVKHDGTAEGFAQILITYTLGTVTVLLGLCTLWLACGTLARDVEECQIQMVVVKPIARWQIWLGKWLGLVLLNAALLAVSGLCLYGLLEWRARKLAPEELFKLQTQVLVARASAREGSMEQAIATETARRLEDQRTKGKLANIDVQAVEKKIKEQVLAEKQSVSPNKIRVWRIHLGVTKTSLGGQPLYLRSKFNSAEVAVNKTYPARWTIGDPAGKNVLSSEVQRLSPDAFHEFPVPSEVLDDQGNLVIVFQNLSDTALVFQLDDGLEVMYHEGGFVLNLTRGLGIILCWMALFAALGLAAASLLSFPVAAFCSLAILSMGLSSGTLAGAVSEGAILGGYDRETGITRSSAFDTVMLPVFRALLDVINLVQQFSPVDSLSTGRSVSWSQLGQAAAQIVLLMGGVFGAFGIFVFHRRELAATQPTH